MPSEYEIKPTEEPPDFTFEGKNDEETKYGLLYLTPLSIIYNQYRDKPPDSVLKTITKDLSKTRTSMIKGTSNLEIVFDDTVATALVGAGIVEGNVPKAGIKNTVIKYGILEQKSTIDSIVLQLETGIKSKAYFLINRGSESIFDISSNFRTAVSRTKNMAVTGFRQTIYKAEREAKVFLYGDPLSDWITKEDGDVCKFCLAVQSASPMPLSKMPLGPLHPHCGDRCKIANHKDNVDLTEVAMELMRY